MWGLGPALRKQIFKIKKKHSPDLLGPELEALAARAGGAMAGGEMTASSAVAALVPAAAAAAVAVAGLDRDREVVAASSVVSPANRPPTGTRPTRSQPYLHGDNCMRYIYKTN
jgi:hypothetical protein